MAPIEGAGAGQRVVPDHAPGIQPRLDVCIAWFQQEPRPAGFTKATVTTWQVALEAAQRNSAPDAAGQTNAA